MEETVVEFWTCVHHQRMGTSCVHDIVVQYMGKKSRIPNIGPDRCSKSIKNELVINSHVFYIYIIPGDVDDIINNYFGDGQENLGIESNVARQGDEFVRIEEENELYDSSFDESWIHAVDTDEEGVVSDDVISVSYSNKSDIEVNKNVDIFPDTESNEEPDHMKATMRSNMWTYNTKDDIDLVKRVVFTNVDAFRAALKDYVIQKDSSSEIEE
ncbi:hypothetical protein ACH5RR_015406 [Cinchona calisaya]|uniref:Transposase n=1 Tax=Cinchona calisaya TaxID=153742 RepID=A0ABD2ZWN2_9GENT